MIPRTICLHGPESTGKSTLAPRLAAHLGGEVLDEYGRDYAEANGIDFTMDDLLSIAKTHDARTLEMIMQGADPLILDTDPLMTAVWADMLFGERDPWFDAWTGTADLYLLLDVDLPWIEDGTRMFGTPELRAKFFDLSKAELERRGVPWVLIGGAGEARFESAVAAIEAAKAVAAAA
ncbi:MAG: N-acetylglucosamine-6-phosphate isomerase [Sphingomonadales bacterium]|nr:MAG: N-acetylglucosamine-6-phosphate isomerase [Sphingomonadales bacterium]